MITLERVVTVSEDGKIVMNMPPEVPPGRHRVVLIIEEPAQVQGPVAPVAQRNAFGLRMHDDIVLPEGSTLRREEMYGDEGR